MFIVGSCLSLAGEVGTSQALTLNASLSLDLDGFSTVPFQYTWMCQDSTTLSPCVRPDGTTVDMSTMGTAAGMAVVVVPAGTMRAGTYFFTVTVSKGVIGGIIPNVYRSAKYVLHWRVATCVVAPVGRGDP